MVDMERFPTVLIPSTLAQVSAQASSDSHAAPVVQQQRLCHALSQTVSPSGEHHKPPKGHSETQFERDLWRYFPGKIHTGLMMPRPNHGQPYVPDFAYIDPQLNLHIDIEVDEPYTHDTRQPIHYLGCPKDEQRNQWFLKWGWPVIRFSESQVVKSPMSCCKTVAGAIASITGDNSIMASFRQSPTLKPERRWTYAEAQQMAEKKYRECYLETEQSKPQTAKRKKPRQAARKPQTFMSANLTFYCPECGDGPIRWQGHYIQCPNCSYDAFAL